MKVLSSLDLPADIQLSFRVLKAAKPAIRFPQDKVRFIEIRISSRGSLQGCERVLRLV